MIPDFSVAPNINILIVIHIVFISSVILCIIFTTKRLDDILYFIMVILYFAVMLSFSILADIASKNISTETSVEILKADVIPKEDLNKLTGIIANGKEVPIVLDGDTKYIQDNTGNLNLKVKKVKYRIQPKFYLDLEDVENINSTVRYIVEEVHY